MRLSASEREIQASILELLRLEGIYAIRLNSGAVKVESRLIRFHSGGSGVADIVAFPRYMRLPGHVIVDGPPSVWWIEVKSEIGRQTENQRNFEEHVKGLGMYYTLARDLDSVTRWIREHR